MPFSEYHSTTAAIESTEQKVINPVEAINRAASYFFPDDPVMQRLFLDRLSKGPAASTPELEAAMQERGITQVIEIVDVFSNGRVEVPADADANKTRYIITPALNGCTATVVCEQSPNGDRAVSLTHYPPISLDRQIDDLKELCVDMQGTKNTGMIFYQKKRSEHIPKLQAEVKLLMGNEPKLEGYQSNTTDPNSGILIIKVPPAASGKKIEYIHWQGGGSLSD